MAFTVFFPTLFGGAGFDAGKLGAAVACSGGSSCEAVDPQGVGILPIATISVRTAGAFAGGATGCLLQRGEATVAGAFAGVAAGCFLQGGLSDALADLWLGMSDHPESELSCLTRVGFRSVKSVVAVDWKLSCLSS